MSSRFRNGSKPCPDCGRLCALTATRCRTCDGIHRRQTPLIPPTLAELFAKTRVDSNGCRIWIGARDGKGYGNVGRGRNYGAERKNWIVHRLVYELAVGPIPPKHDLHHRCETKLCVNPEHLEPVTRREHHGLAGKHPQHMQPAWDGRDRYNATRAACVSSDTRRGRQ